MAGRPFRPFRSALLTAPVMMLIPWAVSILQGLEIGPLRTVQQDKSPDTLSGAFGTGSGEGVCD